MKTFVALALLTMFAGCSDARSANTRDAIALTGGDPARGRIMLRTYGCQNCHVIPGVRGAEARIGPPLDGIGSRTYVAGVVANTPGNMVRWILDPPSVDSLTAMPNVGVTPSDARHIAAYLYTLR